MNTILTMNLTGSALILAYYLFKYPGKNRLGLSHQYLILRAAVFSFLVPLVLLGDVYNSLYRDIAILRGTWQIPMEETPYDKALLHTEDGIRFSFGLRRELVVVGIFLGAACILLLCWGIPAFVRRRSLKRLCSEQGEQENFLFEEIKNSCGIKRKVRLLPSSENGQTATDGLLHPIIFYQEPEDKAAQKLILSHEMYHVKRWDVLWLTMARLASCIHFYNPLVHLLRREMEILCEQSCDEWVTRGKTPEEKALYMNLMVKYSCHNSQKKGRFSAAFARITGHNSKSSKEYRRLKERMDLIMSEEQGKKWRRRTASIIVAGMLFLCSLTTMAYDNVMEIEARDAETVSFWTTESEKTREFYSINEDGATEQYPALPFPVLYDRQFIDEEGNIFPLEEGAEPDRICLIHDYVSVTTSIHEKHSDGSCTTIVYSVQRCTKCGNEKDQQVINTINCDVCVH